MLNLLALIPAIGDIISKFVPDPIKKAEIQAELMKAAMNADSELYKARGGIITAEAQGESWMQRNWRPITMLTFVFIIANNYIIVPYASFITALFGLDIAPPSLEIPAGMWGLLQIGIGGYIASRGVEKAVTEVQKGGVPILGGKASTTQMKEIHSEQQKMRKEMNEQQEELMEKLRGA